MSKTRSTPAASESRLFVLALGLLVGFVIAFVLLLSRLPVDGIISQHSDERHRDAEVADMDFDYYSVLQEQKAARKPERQLVAVEPPVVFIEPPTQILPQGDGVVTRPTIKRLPTQSQSAPSVATPAPTRSVARPQADQPVPIQEIPASRSGQDSYYMEAGNYRENDEAQRAQDFLRSLGLESFIVVRQDNNGGFGHRVRIGPFFEQSRLNDTRTRLRDSGVKARLIRVKG